MSKSNPEKAVRALLAKPIDCGNGVKVYPLSLGHYAILEYIGSPMLWTITTDEDVARADALNTIDLIPSLYVCTHDARVLSDNLNTISGDAMEWAGNLQPSDFELIKGAIDQQVKSMLEVVPQPEEDKKKAVDITAG